MTETITIKAVGEKCGRGDNGCAFPPMKEIPCTLPSWTGWSNDNDMTHET